MKSMAEIAAAHGYARQTVYAKLKTAGVNLDELGSKKQGKTRLYDDDAVKVIEEALVSMGSPVLDEAEAEEMAEKKMQDLQKRIEEAEAKTAAAEAKAAAAEEMAAHYKDLYEKADKKLGDMIEVEKLARMLEAQKMLPAGQMERQLGLFGKVKRFFLGDPKEAK